MIEPEVENKRPQVLLALDATNPSLGVLEFSAFLAAQLEAKLHGLLVEDTDLFQVAELPFAREVVLFSAQERRFECGALTRSLKIMAKQLQIYTGTPPAERALLATAVLARQKGRQLLLLVPQGRESLAIQATERLGALRLRVTTVLEIASSISVEEICKRTLGEAIVFPADIPELQDPVWFQRLLDKIRASLVLVR